MIHQGRKTPQIHSWEFSRDDCPRLSKEQQRFLHIFKWIPEITDLLIRSIVPWTVRIACDLCSSRTGIELDDLIGYGMQGTIEAVKAWDPKKGCLTTICYYQVRKKILLAIPQLEQVVKVPSGLFWAYFREKLSEAEQSHIQKFFRKSSLQDQTKHDTLEARGQSEIEEQHEQLLEDRNRLTNVWGILDERERAILSEVAQGRTLNEIRKKHSISRERVRQLRNQAINEIQYLLDLEITKVNFQKLR